MNLQKALKTTISEIYLRKIIMVMLLISIFNVSFSQKIEHLESKIKNGKMDITYDLKGPEGQNFIVRFLISSDGSTNYDKEILTAEGDVGEKVQPGINKKIKWDAKKNGINAENIKFTLQISAMGMPPKKKKK